MASRTSLGTGPATRPGTPLPKKKSSLPTEAVAARKTLVNADLLQEDRQLTLEAIGTCLERIASRSGVADDCKATIRACATLIIHADALSIANIVATAVKSSIQSLMEEIPGVKQLGETAKEYRDFANGAGLRIEQMRHDVSAACEQIRTSTSSTPPTQQRDSPSYANAVRSHPLGLQPPQPALDYGAAARRCQVLIEGKRGGPTSGLKDLNEKQIVAKAQTAIELMKKEGINPIEGIEFIGAICLKHGGVILRLNEEEAATWVKDNREKFLAKMGGSLELKDRACTVVAPFVPVSFDPSESNSIRLLESTNHLPVGSIISARYIKPIERREPHQSVATIYIDFRSEEAANTVIRHKMWIENKRINPFKKSPQVQRCYKCQKIGVNHTAAECKAEHDTCGYCSERHRGSQCSNRDKDKATITCTNCHRIGHGPGSRQCPQFHQARERILSKNPAWTNPFYTTSKGDFSDLINTHDPYAFDFDFDAYTTPEYGGRGQSNNKRRAHPLPRKPQQMTLNFADANTAAHKAWDEGPYDDEPGNQDYAMDNPNTLYG